MPKNEFSRLGQARRDPAVTLLLLAPLALLHLAGRSASDLDAFFLVEAGLNHLGPWGVRLLWILLGVGFLWAVGRVRQLQLAWAGAGATVLLEGLCWAIGFGPGLTLLTQWLPIEPSSLFVLQASAAAPVGGLHAAAVAAGAGLYEELLFRCLGLGGGAWCLRLVFRRIAAEMAARRLAFMLMLFLSSAAFALAHGVNGHTEAFQADILAFRMLAGLAFGLLFTFRGLAVVAYAHFAYDALYLLG